MIDYSEISVDDICIDDEYLNSIEIKEVVIEIPVYGLVKQVSSKERITYNIPKETKQLSHLLKDFDKKKIYKFISVKGGFASINFIDLIAEKETIEDLLVCSLAVGKKQILHLDELKRKNKLKKAAFILGVIFEKRGLAKKYNYYDNFREICDKNNWKYLSTNNHAKVILMRTDKNKYVLETSSNLNENPKMEQFSFEASDELYNFYYDFCEKLLGEKSA